MLMEQQLPIEGSMHGGIVLELCTSMALTKGWSFLTLTATPCPQCEISNFVFTLSMYSVTSILYYLAMYCM